MSSRSFCYPPSKYRQIAVWPAFVFAMVLAVAPSAVAGDAPPWMHALTGVPLPAHDEKTEAVQLYSETVVTVYSPERIRTLHREAYKILRPEGRHHGFLGVWYDSNKRVLKIRGWCIPAQGKDYEVREKDTLEQSPEMEGATLISDTKIKYLAIPAPDVGNIVGYEYETEERPFVLQYQWIFQEDVPVREARYTLQLPTSWEYKATFLNTSGTKPSQSGNQWTWAVSDVKGIRHEPHMPPFYGLAGQMVVSFYPPGGGGSATFHDWRQMGDWYLALTRGRTDASAGIKEKTAVVTAGAPTPLEKIRSVAAFVQGNIRYVAIELGIGGFQPHAATDVFSHSYGDCKDKATLMRSMLAELDIGSYYVIINTRRGSITPQTQANLGFNHVIIAVNLPAGSDDPSLYATINHPKLGKILFFDPTNEFVPFGEIGGYLQGNYGLLVTPDGGELVELPKEPTAMNGIRRSARLTLDPQGTLSGDFDETRFGDRAWEHREYLRSVRKDADRVKPLEKLLSDSLTTFQLTKASATNIKENSRIFGYQYSVVAPHYAKAAGDLLLVRPRVIGSKSDGYLETKDPRLFPVEFEGPSQDTDTFEITFPAGFVVDELPPPVDVDMGFASYKSKTQVVGNTLRYTRTLEYKQLSVPVNKVDELKKLYRIIANDERNAAVLRPGSAASR